MEKFDGCKVKRAVFRDLHQFARFFTDDGIGFSKHSESSCVDDYSLQPIQIDPNSIVWVKE